MRADAAALRKMRYEELRGVDAERQAMYRMKDAQSAVQGAENALKDIISQRNRLDSDVASLREETAEKGRIQPGLAAAVATLAEYPSLIAGARARVEVARAAYDSEIARQAGESVEAVKVVAEPSEADPVDDAPRGRGRPRKAGGQA